MSCLAALLPQWRSNVEIIVIDSASEPPARETLAQLLAENPHIQTHRLERPGLSLARNAAVSLSKGSWLAFLDDDAAPDPEWVSEIVALLKRLPPRTGTVGLYTYPIWPQDGDVDLPPIWKLYLSLVELEEEEDRTQAPVFVGANMLMRRQAVIEAGGFPEHLARQRQLLLSGDEVYVAEKMRRNGWSIWYSCRPRAGHRIPHDRLDPVWLRTRMYWEGVTHMKLRSELDGTMPFWPVIRAFALAPVLIGLSILDSPQGTKVARAMWHFGIVRAYFMRQAPQAASMEIVADPSGEELLALASQSENELPDQR
jgi:glycosyltransferase involved in cell wall biosynthesis